MKNFTYRLIFTSAVNVTIEAEDEDEAQKKIDIAYRNGHINPLGETIAVKELLEINGEPTKKGK